MIAALVLAAALAAATPTEVGRGPLTAGPVLAGDRVAWADATGIGQRLHIGSRIVRRWGEPRNERSFRVISALAADGRRRGAAIVDTCTRYYGGARPCTGRALTGPLAKLDGPLPDRASSLCTGRRDDATGVAAGGGWSVVVVSPYCPPVAMESARGARIIARKGSTRRVIRVVAAAPEPHVAGDMLAWLAGRGVVVYDLRRNRIVRRPRVNALAMDVQADGTLALLRDEGANYSCLSIGGRDIECGAIAPEIALHRGRVLYERAFVGVMLAKPGAEPRMLAPLSDRLRRAGRLDLGPAGATWAQQGWKLSFSPEGLPLEGPAGEPRILFQAL